MITLIVIISFLLDGIISNFIPVNGIFYPLFSLVSIIVIYPYVIKEDYFKYSFFIGLSYDLIYTNTVIFNACLFLILSFLISKIYILINDSKIGLILITVISIILYRSISYFVIFLTGNTTFEFNILFKSIYSSLIINVIYVIILSTITFLLNRKYRFKKGLRYWFTLALLFLFINNWLNILYKGII